MLGMTLLFQAKANQSNHKVLCCLSNFAEIGGMKISLLPLELTLSRHLFNARP